MKTHRRALFLCTGNYYRSRFAEILFNHLAIRAGRAWRATSRGLRLTSGNVGPISRHTVEALRVRGIDVSPQRFPLPVTAVDMETAHHVVAVKTAEHRPFLEQRFPGWVGRVEYWDVDDLDCAAPHEALPRLEWEVRRLLDRISADEDRAAG